VLHQACATNVLVASFCLCRSVSHGARCKLTRAYHRGTVGEVICQKPRSHGVPSCWFSACLPVYSMCKRARVVTFDNPVPPGAPDSVLNRVFQGIDFGTSQWRWSGLYGADPTNSVYFASSSGTSRVLSFAPGPRLLNSINVYTTATRTLTLADGVNPPVTRTMTTGAMQCVSTG